MRLSLLLLTLTLSACGSSDDSGRAPTASFTYNCIEFLCNFDASESSDPDDADLQYRWTFGDGGSGIGKTVSHAYEASGTMTVELTVRDPNNNVDIFTDTVPANGNIAAPYYNGIHDTFAILLLLEEIFKSVQKTGDALQDAVELNGNPLDAGYNLNCPNGGNAEILKWTDDNNNGVIDGSESLDLKSENCGFASTDAFTTAGTIRLSGDFDGSSFRFGKFSGETGRLRVSSNPSWAIEGNVDLSAVRSESDIESLSYASEDLLTYHVLPSGSLDLRLGTPVAMSGEFATPTGITGELGIDFGAFIYNSEIVDPLHFGLVGEQLSLLGGRIGIGFGSNRVYISPDSDLAYLKIEIDVKDDGTINITERFPQSVTIQRL